MRKSDYGASHDFNHANVSKKKNKIHGHGETHISLSIYCKFRHFKYVNDLALEQDIKISHAFDDIIQCGIAWKEQIKAQLEEKEKERNLSTNEKNIESNCSIVRER